jgi:hypothetical protein
MTDEERRALVKELAPLKILEEVLRWGFASSPPREIADVVVQDEYTHDVVMTDPRGVYLCFDTT